MPPRARWATCWRPRVTCRSLRWSGVPLQVDSLLYNCAAVISRGRILGVAPKTYLPTYREFYELRQFTPGRLCHARDDRPVRSARRPVRHPPAVPGRGAAAAHVLRGDLRGPVDAGPALFAGGAGGRDRADQPVRVQRHGGQGRVPAPARVEPVGPLHRRLPVLRRRLRRVHHRPGLGRPRHDLRERLARRGDRALFLPVAPGHRRHRSRSHRPGSHAHQQLRAGVAPIPGRGATVSHRALLAAAAGRANRCCCAGPTSASRTCRPIRPRATSAAARSSRSRSRGWSSDCVPCTPTRW